MRRKGKGGNLPPSGAGAQNDNGQVGAIEQAEKRDRHGVAAQPPGDAAGEAADRIESAVVFGKQRMIVADQAPVENWDADNAAVAVAAEDQIVAPAGVFLHSVPEEPLN